MRNVVPNRCSCSRALASTLSFSVACGSASGAHLNSRRIERPGSARCMAKPFFALRSMPAGRPWEACRVDRPRISQTRLIWRKRIVCGMDPPAVQFRIHIRSSSGPDFLGCGDFHMCHEEGGAYRPTALPSLNRAAAWWTIPDQVTRRRFRTARSLTTGSP